MPRNGELKHIKHERGYQQVLNPGKWLCIIQRAGDNHRQVQMLEEVYPILQRFHEQSEINQLSVAMRPNVKIRGMIAKRT